MKPPILVAIISLLIFNISAKASDLDDFSTNSIADYNAIDAYAVEGSFGISNNEFAPSETSGTFGTTYFIRNTGEFFSTTGGESVSIEIIQTGFQEVDDGYSDAAGLGFSTSSTSYQNGNELLLAKESPGHSQLGSLGYVLNQTTNGFSLDNGSATLTVTRETSDPTRFDYVLTGGGLSQPAAQGILSYPASAGLPVYFGMAAAYNTFNDSSNSIREGNLTFSESTNSSPFNNLPTNGLVSLWSAEGNGLDSFGTNNALVSSGMTYVPGEEGQAFDFDGTSNSTITIPVSNSLNVGVGSGFTLSCWINPASTNVLEPLMEWDGPISWETQLWINTYAYGIGGPGDIFANLMDTTGNIHPMSSSTGIIQTGVFQHIALTYDKITGLGKLYYNGSLVASQNLGAFTPKTDTALLLGARISGGASYYYQGLMDEVSVYNRALSSQEIQELATNEPVITNTPAGTNPQTISPFSAIPGQAFGVSPFTINPPTSSSGLPVILSVLSGPAAISGDTVTITGAGTVVLAADQPGNTNYAAAPEVTTSFKASQAGQTISPFIPIPQQALTEQSFDISSPPSSSGLPVTVSVKGGPATISGNTVTLLGTGIVYVAADQSGNANYSAADEVLTSFVVKDSSQTIYAFANIPDKTYGDPPFAVTPPKSSSHLPVKITVLAGPAKITDDRITITGVGTIVLAAYQSGNAKYASAAEVMNSFTVKQASQTIKLPRIPHKRPGEVIVLPTNASSGLPINYTFVEGSSIAMISGNRVTLTGAGSVVIAANQSGNANYLPAVGTTVSVVVK